MIILNVLLIILVILLLLLLIPIGVDVGYCEGNLRVLIRVACFTVPLYPMTASEEKKEKKPKKKKAETKQTIPDFTKNEILDAVSVVVNSIKKLSFHLHRLKLHFLSAFADPYRTAMVYGYASAAINAFGLAGLKQSDIQLGVDFERENCYIDGYLSVTIRIYFILKFVYCLAAGLLPLLWRRRRRLKENSVAVKGKVA